MDDLSDLKQQKMEGLKKQLQEQQLQQQREQEADRQLDSIVRTLLDDAARTRLNNVKLVNKELYLKAIQYIVTLYRAGRVSGKIDDVFLVSLLKKITGQKKEIVIKRK